MAAEPGLLRLLAWASPAMPIGGFSYSHGLETAIEAGLVRSRDDVARWIGMGLGHGSGWNDALLLAAAHRAAEAGDDAALDALLETGAALRGTAEFGLESTAQGEAMLRTLLAAWPAPALHRLSARSRSLGFPAVQPVVFGVAAAAHGIDRGAALHAFLHAFAAMMVSAGVRLVPLGQTDGQRLTAGAEPLIGEVAALAAAGSLDDIGTAAATIDLCSMAHETQHTRLFRS